MDPEVCNSVPAQRLEIEKVKNGWIVYVGARVCYVFQDSDELGRAVVNLLRTGGHE